MILPQLTFKKKCDLFISYCRNIIFNKMDTSAKKRIDTQKKYENRCANKQQVSKKKKAIDLCKVLEKVVPLLSLETHLKKPNVPFWVLWAGPYLKKKTFIYLELCERPEEVLKKHLRTMPFVS